MAASHRLARITSISPGHDAAIPVPDFNDGFRRAAPDMGAEELGGKPLEFGADAYKD